jgi:hypothetical protein
MYNKPLKNKKKIRLFFVLKRFLFNYIVFAQKNVNAIIYLPCINHKKGNKNTYYIIIELKHYVNEYEYLYMNEIFNVNMQYILFLFCLLFNVIMCLKVFINKLLRNHFISMTSILLIFKIRYAA